MTKEIYGYISMAFTVATYAPYMWSIMRGHTKPHIFSWVIWGLLMAIAGAAQYAGDAGPGAWASLLSAAGCIIIVFMSLTRGDKDITRHDWAVFLGALAAIPLWLLTSDPLAAILLVTCIDVLGYIPTLRKSWVRPREEMPMSYVISNVKHIFSFYAMNTVNVTTMLYPVTLFVMNGVLVAVIYARRAALKAAR